MNDTRLRAVSRLVIRSGSAILAAALVLNVIANFPYAQSPAQNAPLPDALPQAETASPALTATLASKPTHGSFSTFQHIFVGDNHER